MEEQSSVIVHLLDKNAPVMILAISGKGPGNENDCREDQITDIRWQQDKDRQSLCDSPQLSRKHTGRKVYCCTWCNYSTTKKKLIKVHVQKHDKDKPHIRTDSTEDQTTVTGRQQDQERKSPCEETHSEGSAQHYHVCEECGYRTNWLAILSVHKRKHTGENSCSREMSAELDNNKTSSRAETEWQQDESGRSRDETCSVNSVHPEDKSPLHARHQDKNDSPRSSRTHPAKNLYCCNHCSYSTRNKKLIKVHVKVHNKDKPYIRPRTDSREDQTTDMGRQQDNEKKSPCEETNSLGSTQSGINRTESREDQTTDTGRQQDKERKSPCEETCSVGPTEFENRTDSRENHTTDTGKQQDMDSNSKGATKCEHVCRECGYRTSRLANLSVHMKKHAGKNPYSREMSEKIDDNQASSGEDQMSDVEWQPEDNGISSNEPCSVNSVQPEHRSFLHAYARHLDENVSPQKNAPENVHCCTRCSYSTRNKNYLKLHMQKHAKDKPYKCNKCGFKTAHRRRLSMHMRDKHSDKRPHKYDQCDYSASRKNTLDQQMLTHTGEKPYTCEVCGYVTAHKSRLVVHKRGHTGEKPYKCDQCDFATVTNTRLDDHMVKHTGKKYLKCKQCSYKTARKPQLMVHMRTHTGEKPFKCDWCDYSAALKMTLDRHVVAKHTSVKPYQCDMCDYAAVQRFTLVQHKVREHTLTQTGDQRPYKCDQCDFCTTEKRYLDRHVLKHSSEKPFMCDECGYMTRYKYQLTVHKRKHTGERRYKCHLCDYAGARKCNLDQHMVKHTGEKPYVCGECGYRTADKYYLKKHEAIKHNVHNKSDLHKTKKSDLQLHKVETNKSDLQKTKKRDVRGFPTAQETIEACQVIVQPD
ncbi:uncharacterized protein LOC144879107 [Branchiostoma floridae x Branchiostoma japonicum]